MKRRRLAIPFLLFAIFICLLVAAIGLFGMDAYQHTIRVFGKPSQSLPLHQQIIYIFQVYYLESSLTTPANAHGEPVLFEIQPGESAVEIARSLEQVGLVKNADALLIFMVYQGIDRTLQPGSYALNTSMLPIEIAQTIQNREAALRGIMILAGWRLEEVAAALSNYGVISNHDEFIQASKEHPSQFGFALNLPTEATGEGFLAPGRYEFLPGTPVPVLLTAFYTQFTDSLPSGMINQFELQGLDLYQAVTLASIIERETIVSQENPLVASVYLNRLAINMMLQADPTVQYALGFQSSVGSWWKAPLYFSDLEINSPFNTYKVTGLPPGPISSPGMAAIQAVANPAESGYYYFRAACDGSGTHNFAVTYAEHLANACE